MKCVLIFDHTNDIIYTKYNKKFSSHINEFAKTQGLLPEDYDISSKLNANVIVQIFSPIVTSQRIMSCQFGNSYTSIQCENGLNITFEEYMGYLFVCIGKDDVPFMKRFLSICVTIVRYICGPNVLELKNNNDKAELITHLIDCWNCLKGNDQGIFVEAIEQLIINPDLTTSTVQALHEAVDRMQYLTDCTKIHGLLLVQNKFLGLYSSQNAKNLSSTDILFSILLSESTKINTKCETETDSEDEFYSPSTTPDESSQNIKAEPPENYIYSYQVLLSGFEFIPKCIPHVLHICPVAEGINLLLFIETGSVSVPSNLYDSFLHLHAMQSVQIQRDIETLRPVFENLDGSIKKLCDALKKLKDNSLEMILRQLHKHWDFMRKKYQEFIKTQSSESLLRAESMTSGLLDILKQVLNLTGYNDDLMKYTQAAANESCKVVTEKLSTFDEFLKVKAMKNFSLGSKSSLTINKYLEEFPGLVHFIYIDRTNHRVTAPSVDFNADETLALTKQKIWAMINFSRTHLEEGHLSIIWKDTTFSYAYFLWFEDNSGSPVKPTVFPTHASKPLPQPGIFCGDFYKKLKEACFPKMSPNKIRCYELYCVHLGLATAQCVLEHTRRIAATIWELKGHPDHPIDLL